jgi:hypothetical protein
MTSHLKAKITQFFEQYPAPQVSQHLRTVFIGYLHGQLETGYPPDFHLYLWEIEGLFDILDCASDTTRRILSDERRGNSSASE